VVRKKANKAMAGNSKFPSEMVGPGIQGRHNVPSHATGFNFRP